MTNDESARSPEDDATPESPDDESEWDAELTLEQRHAVRRSMQTPAMKSALAKIAQGGVASSMIADIQRKIGGGLAQSLAGMPKNFTVPFSRDIFKPYTQSQSNLSKIAADLSKSAGTSAAQAELAANISIPTIAANPTWLQQYGKLTVDSDIFKTYAFAQPNLSNIAARLVANTDFGQGIASSPLTDLARAQTSWLKYISQHLGTIRDTFYPANLREVDGLTFELIESVVMVDGIALYGVPRASVAEALLHAEGASRRRDILGRRWKQISADCREFAEGIDVPDLHDYSRLVVAALDALDAGHNAAAQALASTIVDTILRRHLPKWQEYTPGRRGARSPEKYNELSARLFIAFAPIWQAYQPFEAEQLDTIPTVFSRHASAHSVGRRQFNRRNAVQGLLLACGLLYRLVEQTAQAVA